MKSSFFKYQDVIIFRLITEKSSPSASQLKESMDLYEEIVTEEQQSRESTYFEVSNTVSPCFIFLCLPVVSLPHRVECCVVTNVHISGGSVWNFFNRG